MIFFYEKQACQDKALKNSNQFILGLGLYIGLYEKLKCSIYKLLGPGYKPSPLPWPS